MVTTFDFNRVQAVRFKVGEGLAVHQKTGGTVADLDRQFRMKYFLTLSPQAFGK